MASTCSIRLIVAILCFSYLICMNGAIPFASSRRNLMQKPQSYEVEERVLLGDSGKSWKMEKSTMRRRLMEIELNDYPGSGANNRHTPRPQLGRGCIDC